MKLPNAENAVVEREKIADYLLNPAHPDNGGKAPLLFGRTASDQTIGKRSPQRSVGWLKRRKFSKAWRRLTVRNTLWMVRWRLPVGKLRWCEPSGSLIWD